MKKLKILKLFLKIYFGAFISLYLIVAIGAMVTNWSLDPNLFDLANWDKCARAFLVSVPFCIIFASEL